MIDLLKLLQSKEEYEASVCLCGSQVCRGSYLNLTGEGAFQKVQPQTPSNLLSAFVFQFNLTTDEEE